MKAKERTPLLEALCILSFLGNGLAIPAFLAAALMNSATREWIALWGANEDVTRFTSGYFLIFTFLHLLSLGGVLFMWKLKKPGFFLYLFAQTGILILPSLILEDAFIPSMQLIFTLLFVSLYARELFRKPAHSLDP